MYATDPSIEKAIRFLLRDSTFGPKIVMRKIRYVGSRAVVQQIVGCEAALLRSSKYPPHP
jgi:hypothetical protein